MKPTSLEAFHSLPDLRPRQQAVVDLLADIGPVIDEHLVAVYQGSPDFPPQSVSGIRTRRNELAKLGLVVDSGERGRTFAGRNAILWKLVQQG